MTEIYLIRHTQAEGNMYRMMQGHWDGKITPHGCKELEKLSERFADIHIDALYSSDLSRAYKTAAAVAESVEQEIITDPRLREISMGPLDGEFFGNMAWENPELSYVFMHDSEQWHFDGAETFPEVGERLYSAVTDIASRHEGQTIAIVSHGISIRCLLSKVNNAPFSDIEKCPICKNTAVSKLIYENGNLTCEYLNDYSHLGELGEYHWWSTADLRDEERKEGGTTVFDLFDREAPAGRIKIDERAGKLLSLEMYGSYSNKPCEIQARARAIKRFRRLGFDTTELENENYE